MLSTSQQFTTFNQAGIDNLVKVASVSLESFARLIDLNLNTARNVLEESVSKVHALSTAKDAEEIIALQQAAAEPAVKQSVQYSRNVYSVVAQTQAQFKQMAEEQLAEFNKNVVIVLDKAAKSAPAGSDVAVAAVKSAISAANAAYDNLTKINRQVVDIAEANLSAATESVVKPVAEVKRKTR